MRPNGLLVWLITATLSLSISFVNAAPYDHQFKPSSSPKKRFDDVLNEQTSPYLSKRRMSSQKNDFYHLASISQPREKNSRPKKPYRYQYDASAGEGMTVYVMDSGLDEDIPEIQNLRYKPHWLLPKTWPPDRDDKKEDPLDHGNCVVSLVAGPVFGVAKNVRVVIVKVAMWGKTDAVPEDQKEAYEKNLLEAMDLVMEDIKTRRLQGKAIVNMSFEVKQSVIRDSFKPELKQKIKDLAKLALIFAGAGNINKNIEGDDSTISSYPALWNKEIPNMKLVGMSNEDGTASFGTKDAPPDGLWAIGEAVKCASIKGVNKPKPSWMPDQAPGTDWKIGTSFATPQVSALAAYIAALPKNDLPDPQADFNAWASALQDKLLKNSWIRPYAWRSYVGRDPVPLVSNRLLKECEGSFEPGCGCVLM